MACLLRIMHLVKACIETIRPHIPNSINASSRWTEISASAKNDTAFDIIIESVP